MSEVDAIRNVIQAYFDAMFESDPGKVQAVFHPGAKITGYGRNESLKEMDVSTFADLVSAQQPSARAKGEPPVLETLSIEVAGNTAVARVRNDYRGLTYLDTLSFIKVEGRWRIYNKLFHIEGKANP